MLQTDTARTDVTIVENIGAAAPPADLIKETTTQTFVKDVIEESKRQPVLIDFWAPWCGPCKQLTPILEKAVHAAKGKVKLVKMNIDEHPQIPGQMGIQSIPAVIAFVNGRPADGFMGAIPESQVAGFIDKLTKGMTGSPDVAEILKEAEAAIAEGDLATAAAIYGEVLRADQTNVTAIAGLARCHVEAGSLDKAKQSHVVLGAPRFEELNQLLARGVVVPVPILPDDLDELVDCLLPPVRAVQQHC